MTIGVDICRVKSLTMDRWKDTEIGFVLSKGNAVVNSILEATMEPHQKISPSSSEKEVREFIKNKYVLRIWAETGEKLNVEQVNCVEMREIYSVKGEFPEEVIAKVGINLIAWLNMKVIQVPW